MMTSPFDLSGTAALVTGANTGLGQGMAVALAEAGADIIAVSRSDASETEALVVNTGRQFSHIQADLGDRKVQKTLVDQAFEQSSQLSGHLSILVNNAGIIKRNEALDFTEDEWDSVMDVNLRASFFLAQSFASNLLNRNADREPNQGPNRRHAGKIINIASMLSYQGGIRVASYTASKSGVMGLTRILANEWSAHNINVNAIAPGYFATNNTAALQADEKRNAEILGRIPAGRWGKPSDLGGAVVFLASAASDYIQGITLPVDGGWLAR